MDNYTEDELAESMNDDREELEDDHQNRGRDHETWDQDQELQDLDQELNEQEQADREYIFVLSIKIWYVLRHTAVLKYWCKHSLQDYTQYTIGLQTLMLCHIHHICGSHLGYQPNISAVRMASEGQQQLLFISGHCIYIVAWY